MQILGWDEFVCQESKNTLKGMDTNGDILCPPSIDFNYNTEDIKESLKAVSEHLSDKPFLTYGELMELIDIELSKLSNLKGDK